MTTTQATTASPLTTEQFIESVIAGRPATAVFDCDGTLWSGDAGSDFMLWSIETGLVSRETADWLDARYRGYKQGTVSEIDICGAMVQIYRGLRENELRAAAREFFRSRVDGRIFPQLRSLIEQLQAIGTDIWAVSSTNNWVIEEGVTRFGIPAHRVLSARVRVRVTDGIITDEIIDVPTDEGKATALAIAGLAKPDAVFGNSIHDAAMIAIARHPYAINPTPALAETAHRNGWPIYYPLAVKAV